MSPYNPEDYELITTLWYLVKNKNNEFNSNYVSVQANIPTDTILYDGVRSLTTGPDNTLGAFAPLGNEFNLCYSSTDIKVNNPDNSSITKPYRILSAIINVPTGSLNAKGGIFDSADSKEEFKDNSLLLVDSGTGIFSNAVIFFVTEDNDGSKFGTKWSRRIEIFKLKK